MPLPDISARLPSALRSTMLTSLPSRPGPRCSRPSAPMPVFRWQTARARAAPGGLFPEGSASTRKSLPRPWCFVNCTTSVWRLVDDAEQRAEDGYRVGVGGEPPDARVASEPHTLAAGETSRAPDREVDRGVEIELAV